MPDQKFDSGAQAQFPPAEQAYEAPKHEAFTEPPPAPDFSSEFSFSASSAEAKPARNRHTKLFSVISYLTWFCWIAAFLLHDKDDKMARHHINQALVVNVLESIGTILSRMGGIIGVVGTIVDFAVLVFIIMGIYRAAKLSDEPLPFIGDIKLLD